MNDVLDYEAFVKRLDTPLSPPPLCYWGFWSTHHQSQPPTSKKCPKKSGVNARKAWFTHIILERKVDQFFCCVLPITAFFICYFPTLLVSPYPKTDFCLSAEYGILCSIFYWTTYCWSTSFTLTQFSHQAQVSALEKLLASSLHHIVKESGKSLHKRPCQLWSIYITQ